MKKEEKTFLRNAILLQLQAAYPASLPDYVLQDGLKFSGYKLTEKKLLAELEYLFELAYITRMHSELSEGEMRSKLSAKGLGYLERNGL